MIPDNIRLSYKNYDGYVRDMYAGEFYIEHLDITEFIDRLNIDEKFRELWLIPNKDLRKDKINKINKL